MTASNWTPATVPTGFANFGSSSVTTLTFAGSRNVDGFVFSAGAPAYTFNLNSGFGVVFHTVGIVNNSSNAPTFNVSNSPLRFDDTSSAGNAIINLNAGTIQFIGNSTAGLAQLNAAAGTTFDFTATLGPANNGTVSAGSISGAGNFDIGAGHRLVVGGNNLSTNLTGSITSGAIEKVGTGTLTLSGTNSYSGGTAVSGGILAANHATAGDIDTFGTGAIDMKGGGLRADVTANLQNAIAFADNTTSTLSAASGQTLTLPNSIGLGVNAVARFGSTTDTGTILYGAVTSADPSSSVVVAGGTLRDLNDSLVDLTFQASTTVNAGAVLDFNDSGNQAIRNLQGNGSVVTGTAGGTSLFLYVDPNSSATFGGVISGSGAVVVDTSNLGTGGRMIFTGANTYGGGTTICDCSTLQLGDATHTASILGAVTNEGIFDIVNADTSGITSVTNEFGGITIFRNSTTAGTMTIDNDTGGSVEFRQTSSADNATINNATGTSTNFFNNSTAGNATINNVGGFGSGVIQFNNFSRAGTAIINNAGFGFVVFNDRATLENAKIINNDGGLVLFNSQSSAGTALASITNNDFGQVHFLDRSTAGSATITNTDSGVLDFNNRSTAGDATIINSSSIGMAFLDQSTAGNAFITTTNNSFTYFFDRSDGGTARFETEAGGIVDFSGSRGPNSDRRINAGSIGGAGTYFIGADNTLITGGNNRSSEVSGVIADFDPCGCAPVGSGSLEKVGTGTIILSGINTYTGTTGVFAGVLDVQGSIASSSLTTVNANAALTGVGTVGHTVIASGGILLPGNGTPGSSMTVSGNLAFQSGALYRVQLNSTTATFANVTGSAALNGAVGASFAAGSNVLPQYTILTAAGGRSGAFAGVDMLGFPAGVVATLSYDSTHAYLNVVLDYAARSNLSVNQQNVNKALGNFFNANGGIPAAFMGLSLAGLSQISGETATGSQQATFDAMNLFMGLLTDPFIDGRGGPGSASSGPTPFADEGSAIAYAAKRPNAARDAFAKFPTKADVARNNLFDRRWSVWGAAYGGGSTTDGNTALGSNTATARAFGFATGADYRISPATLAGFALAGGGTHFAVNGLGSGRSDLFQAGAFVRHTIGPAYVTAALAYGWQDVTTDRTVTVAGIDRLRAQFNANAWSGRVEGGYRFVTPWMGVTPYAAGQFTTFSLPAYAEQVVSGANTFALNYAAKDVTASRTELGVRTDKSFAMPNGIFTLRGRAAWAHNFNTDRSITPVFQTLPGAAFVVNGAAQARDAALTTASAEMKWLNGWSAAATFEGEFSHVTRSYAGKGVARYTW